MDTFSVRLCIRSIEEDTDRIRTAFTTAEICHTTADPLAVLFLLDDIRQQCDQIAENARADIQRNARRHRDQLTRNA